MELKRKNTKFIEEWLSNSKKALLVTGARQVGKTHLIRKVLFDNGCDYLEVNLIETPEAIDVLKQASNVDDLILGLSTISNKKLKKGKSVLFIDEVQRYPDMVSKIKFLVEEGSFCYILSGSLLGVELTGLRSAPVGYLSVLNVYPLDFKEFLQISNVSEEILETLRNCFLQREPVMDAINDKMLAWFDRYLIVGGMPEAVSKFADTNDVNDVLAVHQDIKALYKLDFTQYESDDKKLLISNVYDLIPAELLKQNRRFIVSDIKKGLRFDRIESTFLWLQNAGVVIPAFNATEPRVPLKLNEKHSLFKLYMADVGMLTSEYGRPTKRMLLSKDKNLNAGGIYENAFAQEVFSKGYPLYYYNSNRLGELDFVIEHNGSVVPVEIKSGKDYKVHSAVNHCLNHSEYNMQEAFVFANFNISRNEKVTYLPVYMAMFLEPDDSDPMLVENLMF